MKNEYKSIHKQLAKIISLVDTDFSTVWYVCVLACICVKESMCNAVSLT